MKLRYMKAILDPKQQYDADDEEYARRFCSKEEANLVTSCVDGSLMHVPVLDIDFRCHLRESETPGHFHLVIEKEMEWEVYARLLVALCRAGLIEPGFLNASLDRGYTCVATKPWKDKQLFPEVETTKGVNV